MQQSLSKAELDAVKQERDESSDRVSDLIVQIQNLEFALKNAQGESAGGDQAMPVKKDDVLGGDEKNSQ